MVDLTNLKYASLGDRILIPFDITSIHALVHSFSTHHSSDLGDAAQAAHTPMAPFTKTS